MMDYKEEEVKEASLQLCEEKAPSNRRFALILMSLAFTLSAIVSLVNRQPQKAAFEFYVMSMSYQPEFCYTKRRDHMPGCSHPQDFWKSHLTIHGLWPSYADGGWPQFCTKEVLDKAQIAPLLTQMEHYWPNVKALKPTAAHFYEFWQHEWSKHGTCSGLNQTQYFEAALHHFMQTPDLVSQHYGGVVNKKALLEAYGENTILVCEANYWLSEVRICLGATSDGEPMQRVPCPQTVLMDDSCEGDEIHIEMFPAIAPE